MTRHGCHACNAGFQLRHIRTNKYIHTYISTYTRIVCTNKCAPRHLLPDVVAIYPVSVRSTWKPYECPSLLKPSPSTVHHVSRLGPQDPMETVDPFQVICKTRLSETHQIHIKQCCFLHLGYDGIRMTPSILAHSFIRACNTHYTVQTNRIQQPP